MILDGYVYNPDIKYKELTTIVVACANGYTYTSGTGIYSCSDTLDWSDAANGPRVCTGTFVVIYSENAKNQMCHKNSVQHVM